MKLNFGGILNAERIIHKILVEGVNVLIPRRNFLRVFLSDLWKYWQVTSLKCFSQIDCFRLLWVLPLSEDMWMSFTLWLVTLPFLPDLVQEAPSKQREKDSNLQEQLDTKIEQRGWWKRSRQNFFLKLDDKNNKTMRAQIIPYCVEVKFVLLRSLLLW